MFDKINLALIAGRNRLRRMVREFNSEENGVSNIVATVILILIVVLLAVLFWNNIQTWFSGIWGRITSGSDSIQ